MMTMMNFDFDCTAIVCGTFVGVVSPLINIFQSMRDVEDVKFVINFDFPTSSENYIHRIGRTGRNKQTGTSYAFFTPQNAKHAQELIDVLREASQVVNPKLNEIAQMVNNSKAPKHYKQNYSNKMVANRNNNVYVNKGNDYKEMGYNYNNQSRSDGSNATKISTTYTTPPVNRNQYLVPPPGYQGSNAVYPAQHNAFGYY